MALNWVICFETSAARRPVAFSPIATPILNKRDWGDSKIGRYLIKCLYQNQNQRIGSPLMNTSITALFCCIDDFAKVFEDCERKQLIPMRRKRMRSGKLSLSEMLFIMVLFHGELHAKVRKWRAELGKCRAESGYVWICRQNRHGILHHQRTFMYNIGNPDPNILVAHFRM